MHIEKIVERIVKMMLTREEQGRAVRSDCRRRRDGRVPAATSTWREFHAMTMATLPSPRSIWAKMLAEMIAKAYKAKTGEIAEGQRIAIGI